MKPPAVEDVGELFRRVVEGRSAADRLAALAVDRLRLLASRMMPRRYDRRRYETDTEDVVQMAAIKILNALRDLRAKSIGEFFAFCAEVLRNALKDLAKSAARRPTEVPIGDDWDGPSPDDDDGTPGNRLALWARFHEAVENLPDDQRQVLQLRFYAGLAADEAAQVLAISAEQCKSLFRSARQRLRDALPDLEPAID